MLNTGKKAYLFYGEKMQYNAGTSIVSSWKSNLQKYSKHDKSRQRLNMKNSESLNKF